MGAGCCPAPLSPSGHRISLMPGPHRTRAEGPFPAAAGPAWPLWLAGRLPACDDNSKKRVGSATLARLAYTGPDGLPRVTPIAFYWTGERIVVCTATTSPKVQAL